MSTSKIDGDWIALDGHPVARPVDNLPHWLLQDLREHEGHPDEWVEKGRKEGEVVYEDAHKEGYDDGFSKGYDAGRADALRDEIGE
jgi:flagellar biosynthesis/type III secretory pathway protein FliH